MLTGRSPQLYKQHPDRRAHVSTSLGLGQLARVRIAREHHNILRVLIGRDKPPLGRIERKIPRILAAGSNALHQRERSARCIDREDDQHIVPAISPLSVPFFASHARTSTVEAISLIE
jgi:hypothetical protein